MKSYIVLLMLAAIGIGGWFYYKQPQSQQAPGVKPVLPTTQVERGNLILSVATTGKVVANLDVEIKCKASGEVISLPWDVSNVVKKGDLLMELNPIDEQRQVRQTEVELSASEARLAQAEVQLKLAERNLAVEKRRAETTLKATEAKTEEAKAKAERLKQLLKQKLTGEEEYETLRVAAIQAMADLQNAQLRIEDLQNQELTLSLKRQDIQLAQAKVESDRITLSNSQQRLKDTKVMAPIDGIVTTRNVQTGQIISSGISNVGGGTTVMTISDLTRLFILAAVDESDIGRIEVDQPAVITADAFPQKKFEGKVVRIATRGVTVSNVVTFEVKIEVISENKIFLKPEMTANIEIISAQRDNVLTVAREAIVRKRGKRIVQVVQKDGSTEDRTVEVGISDDVKTEVIAGLKEGETVVARKDANESKWRRDQSSQMQRMMLGGSRGGRH